MIPWITSSRKLSDAVNEIAANAVRIQRYIGVGSLVEATSAVVTESSDGTYLLELDYPHSGAMYSALTLGTIIAAIPNEIDGTQPFRIEQIRTDIYGNMHITARHAIIADMAHKNFYGSWNVFYSASDVASALSTWLKSDGITVTVDGMSDRKKTWNVANGVTPFTDLVRDAADLYGAQLHYTGSTLTLQKSRGSDRGARIIYGVNMTTGTFTMSSGYAYGYIRPYYNATSKIIIGSDASTAHRSELPYPASAYAEPIDVSSYMNVESGATPSQSDVTEAGKLFIADNPQAGMPSVSCNVSFVPDISNDVIGLYDTVIVQHNELGIAISSVVTKCVWNVLLDRYDSVNVGTPQTTIADVMGGVSVRKNVEYINVG